MEEFPISFDFSFNVHVSDAIFIAFILYFLYIITKAYIIYKCVNEKDKLSFKEAVKHNLITQFFNGITPFSTGGQPMEIYMIAEHNIKVSKATSVTIENFIFYQTALVIYGAIAVLMSIHPLLSKKDKLLSPCFSCQA